MSHLWLNFEKLEEGFMTRINRLKVAFCLVLATMFAFCLYRFRFGDYLLEVLPLQIVAILETTRSPAIAASIWTVVIVLFLATALLEFGLAVSGKANPPFPASLVFPATILGVVLYLGGLGCTVISKWVIKKGWPVFSPGDEPWMWQAALFLVATLLIEFSSAR